MKVLRKTLTAVVIMLLAFAASGANAQGFKGILDKLDKIESRLKTLEKTKPLQIQSENGTDTADIEKQLVEVIKDLDQTAVLTSDLDAKTSGIDERINKLSKEIEKFKEAGDDSGNGKSTDELSLELKDLIDELRQVVSSNEPKGFKIKPYGFFKLDMAYDQARAYPGNFAFWLLDVPESSDKDDEFNLTARQTRMGANFSSDEFEGKTVTGKIEVDFYGGGAENKNFLMLRHGYVKVDFKNFFILAGQTSDVISPLVPSTVNYTVLWNSGDIGYRHPQFQFGNTAKEGVAFVGAVSRNIAGDVDGDGNDDGEDNPFPTFQARLSLLKSGKYNIGVSGHYGKMEFVKDGEESSYESYSANLHFTYTFTKEFSIKGEAFTGKTLNQYFGGIGQGYNSTLGKEVETSGGWVNASVKASDKTDFNFGYGIDKPKKDTLSDGFRDKNQTIFANTYTKIAFNTSFGLEVSYLTTGYSNGDSSRETSSVRVQTTLLMKF
ncbi:MAG: hypothetical protein GY863_02605 [bacterium]|nr:hypothetical protein [bacterium]